jgi:hypothetical protein
MSLPPLQWLEKTVTDYATYKQVGRGLAGVSALQPTCSGLALT